MTSTSAKAGVPVPVCGSKQPGEVVNHGLSVTAGEDDHCLAQEGHKRALLRRRCAAAQDVEDRCHLKEEGEKE